MATFPQELVLTPEEEVIVFKIRQLIGDEKKTAVDEVYSVDHCATVKLQGSMYGLEDPKGWPTDIVVNGAVVTSGVEVLSYEFLKWDSIPGPLVDGASLTVVYNMFRHSDMEILNTYDNAAYLYLTGQCGLSDTDLGEDLLTLSTAYVLLSKDMSIYVSEAVNLEDSDSKYDASRRPQALATFMKMISDELKNALEIKRGCKMMSLPVYKVE
jgi:hypothetical protein